MIAIVDYGMGNLRSVEKGFFKVGVDARVVRDAKAINNSKAIVLPGVGAFKDCMKNLEDMSLIDVIIKSIRTGKPYLGLCLGLQVLFSESEEFGVYRGLDVLGGKVARFRTGLKVPHMGWNTVKIVARPPIFNGIEDESYFYFVHSYHVAPDNTTVTAGTTEYGIPFTSMVWKDNVFATQFHPEKSQANGLRILKNFGDYVKKA
jgi:imidazole glycerol-phosphate synthase subunit HisH